MDFPAFLYATRWLIRDTFGQALASRAFSVMLGANIVFIVFCLSISMDGPRSLKEAGETELAGAEGKPLTGPNRQTGHMTMLFGLIRVELFRDKITQVQFLQAFFSSWVAGVAGLLLALMWMAGFIPDAIHPNTAVIQMARPVPLWVFILGKYLGVVGFIALQATIFFVGTWTALGIKTGIWLPEYLVGIPLLVLHFAAFYSVSVYLATLTRSTMSAALGSTIFWILCFAVNYGRYSVISWPILAPEAPPLSPLTNGLIETAYWVLPKPVDFLIVLEDVLDLSKHQSTLAGSREISVAIDPPPTVRREGEVMIWEKRSGAFYPGLSLLTSVLFSAVMLFFASHQLSKNEY